MKMNRNLDDNTWENLFAPFATKPTDGLKLRFWISEIEKLCFKRRSCVFTVPQCCYAFQRNDELPHCLEDVTMAMVEKRIAQKVSVYVGELDPDKSGWASVDHQEPFSFAALIRDQARHLYRKVFSSAVEKSPLQSEDEQFVLVKLVKVLAEAISDVLTSKESLLSNTHMIGYDQLRQQTKEIVYDECSFKVAVLFLVSSSRCSVIKDECGSKIVIWGCSDSCAQVSSIDIKIFRLRGVIEKLEIAIENLHMLNERYVAAAYECVDKGEREKAGRLLKKKNRVQNALQQKELVLDRMTNLLHALEQTKFHEEVLGAFKCGIDTFKSLKQNKSLSVEEIDKTMEEMSELLDDSNEMAQTITMGDSYGTMNGSEDVEDELQRMETGKVQGRSRSPRSVTEVNGEPRKSFLDRNKRSAPSSTPAPQRPVTSATNGQKTFFASRRREPTQE